jgi:glucose/arabinose dehydrogenase
MSFVSAARFPGWQGDLLIGALRDQSLVRLKLDGEKVVFEERLLKGQVGRVRDVRMGPDGLIYLLSDASDGSLMRLEPVAP